MDNQNYNLNYNSNYNPSSGPQNNVSKTPAIRAMIFGIVAIVLACIPFLSIGGIVFGIIGRSKNLNEIARNVPQTYGFTKAGRICSNAGIIAGAIFTVFYFSLLLAGA